MLHIGLHIVAECMTRNLEESCILMMKIKPLLAILDIRYGLLLHHENTRSRLGPCDFFHHECEFMFPAIMFYSTCSRTA